MGKCLITKLKDVVSDTSILRLGELRIGISKVSSPNQWTQGFRFLVNKETDLEIVGDGYFTDKTLSSNNGKSLALTPNIEQFVYVSNGDFSLAVLNKYAIVEINDYGEYKAGTSTTGIRNKTLDISELKFCTSLTNIILVNAKVTGDIGELGNISEMKNVSITNTSIYGDIAKLKGCKDLLSLNVANTQVSGDIGELGALTRLVSLSVSNTQVSGDISKLKSCTELTDMSLDNIPVYGNVGELSTLTKLTTMYMQNVKVTGDISPLKSCTALTIMYLFNNMTPLTGDLTGFSALSKLKLAVMKYSKFTGDIATLPANLAAISFAGNMGSSFTWSNRPSSYKVLAIEGNPVVTNIDKMLQDQALCQVGFTSSDGNWRKTITATGTRTTASDSAISVLQSKGYTVSITPA